MCICMCDWCVLIKSMPGLLLGHDVFPLVLVCKNNTFDVCCFIYSHCTQELIFQNKIPYCKHKLCKVSRAVHYNWNCIQ